MLGPAWVRVQCPSRPQMGACKAFKHVPLGTEQVTSLSYTSVTPKCTPVFPLASSEPGFRSLLTWTILWPVPGSLQL